jgi:N-acetylmuramate 1-kinase
MTSQKTMLAFARKALGLAQANAINLVPLSGRGSDRTFFRLTWGMTNSAILIHYDPKRIENAYYGDIAIFLKDIGVSALTLLHHDSAQCIMLMEDLGSIDLWAMRNEPWDIRQGLYEKTLTIIQRLHSFPVEKFPAVQVKLMEPFGPKLYKWEQDYFRDNFVIEVCKIKLEPVFSRQLDRELQSLAERIHARHQSLVHRDFQSQNIMVRDGEPFLIDFQGMRIGSPFYDLGSLLCDPYVHFSEEELEELLKFYYRLSERDVTWQEFRQAFWEASTQRLMQALGAYGFLGLKKGLTTFLDHIPTGLANLQRAVSHIPSLPHLREILKQCRQCVGIAKEMD